MRLVMTLLVRDEQDIVGANLDFHLDHGVDFVIATDNCSEDDTVSILEEYRRQGVLQLIREDTDDFNQGRWVTRMARLAAVDHGADWVINNDADEFWWPIEGDLASTLQKVPEGTDALLVPRYNFVVPAEEDRDLPFHRRMTVRYTVPWDPTKQGPIQPKMAHRAHPDVVVQQGNHDAQWEARGEVATLGAGVEILHYPIRSLAQFANKIAKGGAAYERNHDVPEHYGRRWRSMLALQRSGEFGALYADVVLDDDAVAAGIARGELVRDRRLTDALSDRKN